MERLRQLIDRLRRTPLHPQWLLGSRAATARLVRAHARGLTLDVGCADRWVETMVRLEGEYVALDYPATGRDMYGAKPDLFGDCSCLPLLGATVDTVLLLDVLEHVRRPALALGEICRVLRPGGRLILSIPFLYPIHDAPHDYQRYTLHGLSREIDDCGLRLVCAECTTSASATAGLLANLAIAGSVQRAVDRRATILLLLLLPIAALCILVINLLGWFAARVLPPWDAMAAGYQLVASKP